MTSGGKAVGVSYLNIPNSYLLAALALLLAAAEGVRSKGINFERVREDRISEQIDIEMHAAQSRGVGYRVGWTVRPSIGGNINRPGQRGEVDFRFHWPQRWNDNRRYLGVEAKKLWGARDKRARDKASKYISGGVLDFVSAKYGCGHNYGIMMGYVVAGPVAEAASEVKRAMDRGFQRCRQVYGFTPNSSLCAHPHTHHSCHTQNGTGKQITLLHIFLDFSSSPVLSSSVSPPTGFSGRN